MLAFLAAAACSKSDRPKQALSTGARMMPGAGLPSPAPDPADPEPTAPTTPQHDPIEYDGAPLSYIVTESTEASVLVIDPDRAVVQAARVSASGCLIGLQGGPDVLSAVLMVSAVPGGQVSRTEVSSDIASREAIDCLVRVGNGLHFSSKEDSKTEGIRSFSIDVTVARTH